MSACILIPTLAVLCSYSRSKNNVSIVYCNRKEITGRYSVITERNLSHSMLIAGGVLKRFI